MHKTRHLLAVFLFNGDHKTPVSDGDDGLLKIFLICCRTDHRIQAFPDALVCCAHGAANARKCRRSAIKYLILADDAAGYLFFYTAVRRKEAGQIVKKASFVFLCEQLPRDACGAQALCNAKQLARRYKQRGMDTLQALAHIGKIIYR